MPFDQTSYLPITRESMKVNGRLSQITHETRNHLGRDMPVPGFFGFIFLCATDIVTLKAVMFFLEPFFEQLLPTVNSGRKKTAAMRKIVMIKNLFFIILLDIV